MAPHFTQGETDAPEGRWHTPLKLGHHQKGFMALDFLCEALLLFVIQGLSPGLPLCAVILNLGCVLFCY